MVDSLNFDVTTDGVGGDGAARDRAAPQGGRLAGSRHILRRPGADGDLLYLVEIGTRRFRHDRLMDYPADDIELIMLGRCDERGRMTEAFDPPVSIRAAPGMLLDARYSVPLPREASRRGPTTRRASLHTLPGDPS